MRSTLPHLLAARAAIEPSEVAIEAPGGEPLTFSRWLSESNRVANALADQGIGRGDRVGLVFGTGDWPGYAAAFCGVLAAGAVAVPLSDGLPAADLRGKLEHCGAVAVIHADGATAPEVPVPTAALSDLDGDTSHDPACAPAELAQILYTSGTTGRPKGVAATHANLAHGCGGKRRPFAHSRHLAHAFPIGTNAGQVMLINALDARPALVAPPRFTPARFAALIERYRAGTVFLVPAMAVELLAARVHERHDLSSVLLLGSAAAPLPARIAADLSDVFPNATIANYYTSTEAAPAQTVMLYDPDRPTSVGRPASGGAVRIATADGRPLPPGESGEVWMRSPAATRAYYGDPDATRQVFRDGWVRMGDLGRLDDEGYLYLVDRESDVLKSGAHKVSTLRVEEAVYACPGVVEAAAFGMPHPTLGTAVNVAVVGPVAHEELRMFLKDRLAPYELPVRLVTLDALPRNLGGKVDKSALREAVS
ncbi:class I adenylate-forming enzyme family protein [Nonomuraea antri]|uniref:class I adenylate-forming enzyme family protein n=1 Tax=Nonomuraea antri TaxID=2730852 RepID=UPI002E2A94E2|nr:class I adenylate-forming enzyme family protein [Nonomuraea antri]